MRHSFSLSWLLTGSFFVALQLAGCSAYSVFEEERLGRGDGRGGSTWTTPAYRSLSRVISDKRSQGVRFDTHNTLELDALVDAVLHRNPTIEVMEQTWRAAAAREPQVTSLQDPMLAYSIAPLSFGDSEINDGHKVELSQRLPWPGKLRLRGAMARHEAEAASFGVETIRQRLIQQTVRAYFDYYYIHRAIEINEVNINLLEEFQHIAETKYAAGTASKQDPLQAEVERYHLEHRAIELQRMRAVTEAHINTLLHRQPRLPLPPPPHKVAQPAGHLDLNTLVQRSVNTRPELQALARRLKAKRIARHLAEKEYNPDFTVMGTYNSMWDTDEHQWMVGVGINLPIQTDRRRGAELEALAEHNSIAARLMSGVDNVKMEVTQAYDLLEESEHVIRLYHERFNPIAEENLNAARSGYETGDNDFLSLLTAEKNVMLVQLAYQKALAEYHQRWADLERAVGGEITATSLQPHPKNHTDGGHHDQ